MCTWSHRPLHTHDLTGAPITSPAGDRVVLVPQKAVGILAAGASTAAGATGAAQSLLNRHHLRSSAGTRSAGVTQDGETRGPSKGPLLVPTASVVTGMHQQSGDGTSTGASAALATYSSSGIDQQQGPELALSTGLLASPLLSHELRKLRGVARGSLSSQVQQQRRTVSMNAAIPGEIRASMQSAATGDFRSSKKVAALSYVPATVASTTGGASASPMLSPMAVLPKATQGVGGLLHRLWVQTGGPSRHGRHPALFSLSPQFWGRPERY
jgi:hypothetical protein